MKYTLFVVYLLIFLIGCQRQNEEILRIKPLLENIDSNTTSVTIDPKKAQTVKTESGFSFEVPENAFVAADGSIITEPVEIRIETYTNPAEIIASGIPMTFNDAGENFNFESAGMFNISGFSNGQEIFIQDGKSISTNYASDTYGEFDFYHFQTADDVQNTGKWTKLTNKQTLGSDTIVPLDSFQLKFDIEKYPELAPLEGIQWRLANEYGNPNKDENKWVLDQKWEFVEITKPKYGFGEVLFSEEVDFENHIDYGAFFVTKDLDKMITTKKPYTKIWDGSGRLIKTINNVNSDFYSVRMHENLFVSIRRENKDHIYDLDGNLIVASKFIHGFTIIPQHERLIFKTAKNTLEMRDFSGKVIFQHQFIENSNTIWSQFIINQFLIVDDKVAINTNSGVDLINTKGKRVNRKKAEVRSLQKIDDHTLLIFNMDGSLSVWDFVNKSEIKSKELIRTLYDNINIQIASDIDHIFIYDDQMRNSKLWNYKTNKVIQVDFRATSHILTQSGKILIEGYNYQNQEYCIYEISSGKCIITIPTPEPCYDCDRVVGSFVSKKRDDRLLLKHDGEIQLINLQNTNTKSLSYKDIRLVAAGFISDGTIYTLSENGDYRIWSMDGEELSNRIISNKPITGFNHNGKIETFDRITYSSKRYDFRGNLLIATGRTGLRKIVDKSVVIRPNNQFIQKQKLFKLPNAVYQLIIRKENREFVSYIHLTSQQEYLINQYNKEHGKWINEKLKIQKNEDLRQEEEFNLIRSLEINSFGLYNWDRLIKEAGSIKITAEFDFEDTFENNNITVFHLSKLNGNIVVSYHKYGSETFTFNPNLPNQLIAILPGNKVAHFSQEDFDKINLDRLQKDKSFTFGLKTIDQPIDSLVHLEKVIGGSTD